MSLLLAQDDFNVGDFLGIAIVVGAVVVLFVLLIIIAVFANYFRLWIQSFLTGAGITIWDLIGMTFRKVNKDVIVKSQDHGRAGRPRRGPKASPARPWKPITWPAATCRW